MFCASVQVSSSPIGLKTSESRENIWPAECCSRNLTIEKMSEETFHSMEDRDFVTWTFEMNFLNQVLVARNAKDGERDAVPGPRRDRRH